MKIEMRYLANQMSLGVDILLDCVRQDPLKDNLVVQAQTTIYTYRQVSNIRRTLVGNYIVDHSDVVGASPVGAAPTTSSFST